MHRSRRKFLKQASLLAAVAAAPNHLRAAASASQCQFGLVTYLWGKDLSLDELLSACESSQVLGIELRTTHQHGVERDLSAAQRADVKRRFADSPVTLVGIGSNERFDNPDTNVVRAAVDASKDFIRLSHDVGGSGVKVKGDRFYDDVPREKTIDQVTAALRELGNFANDFDQQVRLEVHGGFRDLTVHHEIIKRTNHPRVRTCWNSNPTDLQGAGLASNFALVRDYFGATAHIRQLDDDNYPWADLMRLFIQSKYDGWVLLEAHGKIPKQEVVHRLSEQRQRFQELVVEATKQ